MSRFASYQDSFPNARLTRSPSGVLYDLALEGISAADVARSMANA